MPKVALLRNKGHLNVDIAHLTNRFLAMLLMYRGQDEGQKEESIVVLNAALSG